MSKPSAIRNQPLQSLYTAEQVRQLELLYARFHDGATYPLMERAGAALYTEMRERWPDSRKILVVCGKGNNAGDGFVVARLAAQAGLEATVAMMDIQYQPQGDAEKAYARLKDSSATIIEWQVSCLESSDLVVDAMLGTGLKGELKPEYQAAIQQINQSNLPVIAADIPSGLDADSGAIANIAIHADVTVTFIGIKRGMTTGLASDYCGEIILNQLNCGNGIFALIKPQVFGYDYSIGKVWLQPRRRTSHKGFFGHVLVIGGAPGYAGAAKLTAEAALRSGAGLVSLLTHTQHAHSIGVNRPEIMCHSVNDSASKESIKSLLDTATVIAIGPGLGQLKWGRNLIAIIEDYMQSSSRTDLTTIWDADALNILAERPRQSNTRVITPHPGEASRLLGKSVTEIQADRFAVVNELQHKFGGIALLKGAGTVIANSTQTNVVQCGNPGMASGGMGDCLTGIIAGLAAQKIPLFEATRLGCAIHGEAAELAVLKNSHGVRMERGLLASDLLPHIWSLVNP